MTTDQSSGSVVPAISVIIAIYNDWLPLRDCLAALRAQTGAPPFEIVIVDDGSVTPVPDDIRAWGTGSPSLRVVSQNHAGVAAARNLGLRTASGELLMFTDADCVPASDCLAQLFAFAGASPSTDYFQLHLTGDLSSLPGRAEELRLEVTQRFLLQRDGTIHFLNTAGFALRRSALSSHRPTFDETALRGEDTLLFAELLRRGIAPRFVDSAIVSHRVRLTVFKCLVKDVHCARLEAATLSGIAGQQIEVRVTPQQRRQMLHAVLSGSRNPEIGRTAGFFLILRQTIRFVLLRVYPLFRRSSQRAPLAADQRR
jgi:glycosyltransferase involved in cell wall biosynthesis